MYTIFLINHSYINIRLVALFIKQRPSIINAGSEEDSIWSETFGNKVLSNGEENNYDPYELNILDTLEDNGGHPSLLKFQVRT